METENKDWKPEVGKTAWLKRYSDKIEQVMITADYTTKLHYKQMIQIGEGEVAEYYSAQDRDYFFESPEAALASIKIYDLDGKEVLIPRAEPDFSLEEMVVFFNKWIRIKGNMKLFFEAQNSRSRASEAMDAYIEKAKASIRGGAAIGGKSEPKQDEPCHVCQLTKYERRGKPCAEIRCPNQFVDRGGKSDQREGGC